MHFDQFIFFMRLMDVQVEKHVKTIGLFINNSFKVVVSMIYFGEWHGGHVCKMCKHVQ
jgi:hypothetical protein